tara:strand:+ start:117 stop:506 length:390 start_codon:yes stop_codon:yes gene_type:complete
MIKVRGYIFSRPFMGERVPQSVQNLVIRNYCTNQKLFLLLSATEYAMKNSDLMLFKILNELNKVDGIVAYSLYQLPESNFRRKIFFEKILENRKKMFFALEGITLENEKGIDEINILWNIKKTIPLCMS